MSHRHFLSLTNELRESYGNTDLFHDIVGLKLSDRLQIWKSMPNCSHYWRLLFCTQNKELCPILLSDLKSRIDPKYTSFIAFSFKRLKIKFSVILTNELVMYEEVRSDVSLL